MKHQVQLITYVDRLGGGGIAELAALLRGPLKNLFGGVHLLPFFHPIDGSDAGFDPIDHTRVDPRLGDWGDIKILAEDFDVMADVIVNHISRDSPQFRDYFQKGSDSVYAGLFLTQDAVFPHEASETELRAIYRPRPGPPFTRLTLENGEQRVLWTTFTPQQVDIDVRHTAGAAYLAAILQTLATHNVRAVRLDAVGYAIKRAGTSCFMLPETFEFIRELSHSARNLGIEVLVEIHSHYRKQIDIAAQVDWVYDFALPPLILHAFAFRTTRYLKRWIAMRPPNAISVLDTHDGIGIIDAGGDRTNGMVQPGLVPDDELAQLVEVIHENSRGESRLATGASASNLDLYQVNCTYYDALGRDDSKYLLARAIQFFLPGIPQVYYVGLLAGSNDMTLLARTRVGRDINRHYYDRAEIHAALRRPVVQNLFELIRLRNTHPAFGGQFQLDTSDDGTLVLRWTRDSEFAELVASFASSEGRLRFSSAGHIEEIVLGEAAAATVTEISSEP